MTTKLDPTVGWMPRHSNHTDEWAPNDPKAVPEFSYSFDAKPKKQSILHMRQNKLRAKGTTWWLVRQNTHRLYCHEYTYEDPDTLHTAIFIPASSTGGIDVDFFNIENHEVKLEELSLNILSAGMSSQGDDLLDGMYWTFYGELSEGKIKSHAWDPNPLGDAAWGEDQMTGDAAQSQYLVFVKDAAFGVKYSLDDPRGTHTDLQSLRSTLPALVSHVTFSDGEPSHYRIHVYGRTLEDHGTYTVQVFIPIEERTRSA